jgi:hypothetical protein
MDFIRRLDVDLNGADHESVSLGTLGTRVLSITTLATRTAKN